MAIDVAQIAALGGQIATLGLQLNELREKRDVLNAEIAEVEKELMPLVVQHTQLVAAITGIALPAPASPPTNGSVSVPVVTEVVDGVTSRKPDIDGVLIVRIQNYLKNVDGSASAVQIAEALHVDPYVIREAMRKMRHGAPEPPVPPGF